MRTLSLGVFLFIASVGMAQEIVVAPMAFRVSGSTYNGFMPSDSAGLFLWLAADSISGKSEGDTVGLWRNLGSFSTTFSQATLDEKPTYDADAINGHPALVFSTASMFGGTASGITGATIFIVAKHDNTTDNAYIITAGGNSNAVITGFADGTIEWYNNPSRYTIGSSSTSWAIIADTSGNPNTETSGWVIGASESGNSDKFAGSIAEIIIYDHPSTATLRSNVIAYLTGKYRL